MTYLRLLKEIPDDVKKDLSEKEKEVKKQYLKDIEIANRTIKKIKSPRNNAVHRSDRMGTV